MTEPNLAEATRDLANTGKYRAFLVSDVELPTDQSRVEQENQIAQCMHGHGGPYRYNIALGTNAEDTRDRRCIVRMVTEFNGDAEQNVKRVVVGLP